MKAFGEKSLSSVLRIGLEVMWYVTLLSAALWVIAVILAALGNPANMRVDVPLSFELEASAYEISSETIEIESSGFFETRGKLGIRTGNRALLLGYIFLGGSWIALLLVVLHQTRAVLRRLAAGEPFAWVNASRVRLIGYLIVALELFRWAVMLALSSFAKANLSITGLTIVSSFRPNLGLLFVGGVVLLIAEVFRQASVMHEEQSLTV